MSALSAGLDSFLGMMIWGLLCAAFGLGLGGFIVWWRSARDGPLGRNARHEVAAVGYLQVATIALGFLLLALAVQS